MRFLAIVLGTVGLAALVGCASAAPSSVTRSFWQATIDGDFAKARSFATATSHEELKFLESNWDDTVEIRFDVGTATIDGDKATCPMTYRYPEYEGHTDGFVTHLVREDGAWKVDAVQTMKPMLDEYAQAMTVAGKAVQAAMDQLFEDLGAAIGESIAGRKTFQEAMEERKRLRADPPTPPAVRHAGPLDHLVRTIQPFAGDGDITLDDRLAVYFTFALTGWKSTIVQADWDGTVRAGLDLPYSISGLAPDGNRLLGSVASPMIRQGRVVALDEDGAFTTVFRDNDLLLATTAIWTTPDSGEMLLADNRADLVVAVPKSGGAPAETRIRIGGPPEHAQSMSVARCADGSLVYSGSCVAGVFRMPPGAGPALGKPLLHGEANVAAHPTSDGWVAALATALHVFAGEHAVARLRYPDGTSMLPPTVAFSPDGLLVVGWYGGGGRTRLYAVDLAARQFHGLFSVSGGRLTGLAIAPKMPWKSP
jgi:hypothetical protein